MGTQRAGGASLGTVIRERRQRAGWTQRQLAEATAVSVGIIRDLEQGLRPQPRRAALKRLAAALNINLAEVQVFAGRDGAATRDGAGASLRLSVLGPLRVWRDGVAVPVGGDRRKAVLGLLALNGGAVVSHAAFTRALWDEQPPPTATAMIQTYVSRIRAALEAGPSWQPRQAVLQRAGDGYRLRRDGIRLDLRESEELARDARGALATGRPEAACALFEQALDLWHEEPLADVGLLRGHPAVVRLEAIYAGIAVEHAETAVAQGWYRRALPRLYALIERAPLHENAHACLMVALAGTGQRPAALELYQRIRARLDEELGVTPSRQLADAQLRVLRGQVPVAARESAPLQNGPAVRARNGARAVAGTNVADPTVDDAMPAGASAIPDAGPFQLPPAVADFTGREPEIARLRAWLLPGGDQPGVPVVVVSGPPGVGKSALMLQASHLLRRSFPDGQLWATLDGASERPRRAGEVLGEWLRALGVHGSAIPDSLEERAGLYRSRLADRRMLIVADDAESAAQVLPLLPGTAGCAVIVTSRRQLADAPSARLLALGPLSTAEATQLLARIAGPDRVTAEAQAAGDLVAACGRLPLAVRVAGAKLAALQSASIAALAGMLAKDRRRLDVLRVGDLSVRASIASGYRALSEPARRAFRLLGLLGPCDVTCWVVAALLDEPDATAVVEELTGSSMATAVGADATGQGRYRLHDLLRDFAAAEAASMPETEQNAALTRVHNGWLQLAASANCQLPTEPFFPAETDSQVPGIIPAELALELTADPLAWFRTERLNLLTATERSCGLGQHRLAARLARAQESFQRLQDRYDDAARIWRAVAAAAMAAGDMETAGGAGLRLAAATSDRGYSAAALTLLDEWLATFGDDGRDLPFVRYWRSYCMWDLGSFDAARCEAESGLRTARQVGDRHAEFLLLRVWGHSLAKLGDSDRGVAACERAMMIADELDGTSFRQYALHSLAFTCTMAGQAERAIELAALRFDLCRGEADVRGQALAKGVLGDAYRALGQYENAVEAYSLALQLFRDHAIRRHYALCLFKLGCALEAMGDHEQAASSLRESLPIFRELDLSTFEEQAGQVLRESLRGCCPAEALSGCDNNHVTRLGARSQGSVITACSRSWPARASATRGRRRVTDPCLTATGRQAAMAIAL